MVAPGENGIVRYAQLIRTRKYVAVISMDNRGGSFFSVTGWSTFIDRKDATPEWIGENLKKALQTSRDLLTEWGNSPLRAEKVLLKVKNRVRFTWSSGAGFRRHTASRTGGMPGKNQLWFLPIGNASRRIRSVWQRRRGGEQVTPPGIRTKMPGRSFMPRSMPAIRSLVRSPYRPLMSASQTICELPLLGIPLGAVYLREVGVSSRQLCNYRTLTEDQPGPPLRSQKNDRTPLIIFHHERGREVEFCTAALRAARPRNGSACRSG